MANKPQRANEKRTELRARWTLASDLLATDRDLAIELANRVAADAGIDLTNT